MALEAVEQGNVEYDGYVALGCVIRGETTPLRHRRRTNPPAALMDLAMDEAIAIGNGILTVENDEQAWARARVDGKNKGGAAAEAALRMIALRARFKSLMAAATAEPAERSARPANQRGAARLAAVQALYQMDLAGATLPEVIAEFETYRLGKEVDGDQYRDADAAFFRDIVAGVVRDQKTLDPAIDRTLAKGWPLTRIDTTLRAILRCRRLRAGEPRRRALARRDQRICRRRQGLLRGRRAGRRQCACSTRSPTS